MKKIFLKFSAFGFLLFSLLTSGINNAKAQEKSDEFNRTILPIPDPPFKGKIGLRPSESVKDFPNGVEAPEKAPNILLIMTDDVGFGAASCFGGPVPTPAMDRVAEMGLRYNTFHTTALCSPTRAALLTGRNHHSVGTAAIMEVGIGYPGYNTIITQDKRGLGDILKLNGYNTSWYGKNHNVPDWMSSQAGPFDLWPVGLGFEYFYGFVGGDVHQFSPAIFENTLPVEPPHDDPNYHFDKDMADHCIKWLQMQNAMAPDKPFFAYYAPGTAHAPHHAPKEWIDKFKGQFDEGWDVNRERTFKRQKKMGIIPENTKLTERSAGIPAWETLDNEHKKVYARMMEVYAGALAHCDYQISRIIDVIEDMDELDNTLIIYIQGDNGASAEGGNNGMLNEITIFNAIEEDWDVVKAAVDELGGTKHFNHYPAGWAHSMDTPFQWTKQVASHFGGTRNALAISWPSRIKDQGGIRSQFHHVIDILPTILEATGIPAPIMVYGVDQAPVEGTSMVYTWNDQNAEDRHTTQYFEILGYRAIYNDGWVAATTPPSYPWDPNAPINDVINGYEWELYNVKEDFSEAQNLADKYPDKLHDMKLLFYTQAAKYQVLPIDNSKVTRFDVKNRPSLTTGRNEFTYYDGMTRIPEGTAPDFKNCTWNITAEIEIGDSKSEGVLITQGGQSCGMGLYLLAGKPVFYYNTAGVYKYNIAGKNSITNGKHKVSVDFNYEGGGVGKAADIVLKVDGKEVASKRIEHTIPQRVSLDETMDIGEDTGTPVSTDYKVPFKFNGELYKVTVTLK